MNIFILSTKFKIKIFQTLERSPFLIYWRHYYSHTSFFHLHSRAHTHTDESIMILSTSSTKVYTCLTAPRVSASHSTSRISYSVKSGCGGARRFSRPSCLLFCASKLWGMAEMLNERKNSSSSAAAAAVVVASSSASDHHEISPPRSFIDARTEQGLFSFNFLFELALILYLHYLFYVFFFFLIV